MHEERTHAGDHAIREAEIGASLPGTIEDQQLLLDEHGFSDHGTRAAGTSESAIVASLCSKRTARSRTTQSQQDRDIRKKRARM